MNTTNPKGPTNRITILNLLCFTYTEEDIYLEVQHLFCSVSNFEVIIILFFKYLEQVDAVCFLIMREKEYILCPNVFYNLDDSYK